MTSSLGTANNPAAKLIIFKDFIRDKALDAENNVTWILTIPFLFQVS